MEPCAEDHWKGIEGNCNINIYINKEIVYIIYIFIFLVDYKKNS